MTDETFVSLVTDIDRSVAEIDGHGFLATPFERSDPLARAVELRSPGTVWVKNETGNVSGSHKGRHLMGLAILAEVETRLGLTKGTERLAIASCGNAALAAAVVARAVERPLDVFIPTDANPKTIARLEELGASIQICTRHESSRGDPCYHAFRAAIARGTLPFCCQGSDNGLSIEGGETLGWEVISELIAHGTQLSRVFIQVGGGALASAWVAAFRDAESLGMRVQLPRLHAVQTESAYPLRRAWEKVVARIASRLGIDAGDGDERLAERIREHRASDVVQEALHYAARHRSEFMWPWETTPKSIAHGILDDETYDWLAVVRGTIESGGFPIVVSEARLREANRVGRERTGIDADATGTAGLAGLLELSKTGALLGQESVAVLFTGVKR
jgi:threonine synthase